MSGNKKYTVADLLRDHDDRDMPITVADQHGYQFPIADVFVHPYERLLVIAVDHEDED